MSSTAMVLKEKYEEKQKEVALIVVDVQRDFCKGGALEVPNGDEVVEPLNRCISIFEERNLPIVFTRDWHPPDHISFKNRGGPWPPHCIMNTPGSEFHPKLKIPKVVILASKASERDKEAYSGFDGTGLELVLKKLNVKDVFVGGLATEYCVKNTVLDALNLGFNVFLLVDAIRGVNVHPDDSTIAIEEMKKAGVKIISTEDLDRVVSK